MVLFWKYIGGLKWDFFLSVSDPNMKKVQN